jgi:hypothetical protein
MPPTPHNDLHPAARDHTQKEGREESHCDLRVKHRHCPSSSREEARGLQLRIDFRSAGNGYSCKAQWSLERARARARDVKARVRRHRAVRFTVCDIPALCKVLDELSRKLDCALVSPR